MIVDLVLVIVVAEGLLLLAWHRRTGGGIAAAALVPNLAAGLCLLLAVRAASSGAGWRWIALCLAGSGLAHLLDLRQRWRRAP